MDGSMVQSAVEARRDMAASLRWLAREGMHEGIANHLSLAIGGSRFLMNPWGIHWSRMRASDMLELDAEEEPTGLGDAVDPTAWAIHGALHRNVPHATCVMHLHPHYSTALSVLEDPTLPPVDQTTMRFWNRVAVDTGFDGMGLGDEAERLAKTIGDKPMLMMAQHGVMAVGPSLAQCFDDLYHFERGARTYMTALATGRPLNPASPEVAEKTARQWEAYEGAPEKHLAAVRAVLDAEGADYAE